MSPSLKKLFSETSQTTTSLRIGFYKYLFNLDTLDTGDTTKADSRLAACHRPKGGDTGDTSDECSGGQQPTFPLSIRRPRSAPGRSPNSRASLRCRRLHLLAVPARNDAARPDLPVARAAAPRNPHHQDRASTARFWPGFLRFSPGVVSTMFQTGRIGDC